nr:MAG TPA: hypothetical protein [Bacteriophage sp.]
MFRTFKSNVLSLCSLLNFTILIVLFPNSCIISIF